MGAIGELLGESGVIQQLLLWNVVGQVVTNLMSPAFMALQQDVLRKHPNMVLTPDIVVRAVVSEFMDKAEAEIEAAKSGIDVSRLDVLLKLAEVRLSPQDLAEATLRSYLAEQDAAREARDQGVTVDRFKVLTLLAGDGIGPEQAAEALRRGLIKPDGKGPDSTSYVQAIAESRLHNKWGQVLFELTRALLSPSDAADAVVRGYLQPDAGRAVAKLSGVDTKDFDIMVHLAGDPLSPTQLAEALRRGIIPESSGNPDVPGFAEGIKQGRLADIWIPVLKDLAKIWPTPVDALQARLVGQIDDEESKELYAKFGGDPKYWQLLFNTRGEAPSPLEAITMANRGFMPWDGLGPDVTSFAQAFHEGRWRNKWQDVYRKFAEYQPPEGTIVTLLARGVIDDDQAAKHLIKLGMTDELAASYIEYAHTEALGPYRGASINMVLTAYREQIITADQATQILLSLHMTPQAIALALAYEDNNRAFTAINSAVTRIRTLFAARKITKNTAVSALQQLGVQPQAVDGMVKSWSIENSITVRTLTEAQIVAAWEKGIMSQADAMTELINIGYTPYDAWVLLSTKAGQPLPDQPQPGPALPQGQVTPGTT